MTVKNLPRQINTVIVGNGPSALVLSYILHGYIPYYNPANPHPDPLLHQKLSQNCCLLDADVPDLTAHFNASRFSYSTQALPINVLLDTLLRPLADTDPEASISCVEWRYEESRRVEHIALGNTKQAGGQWADNPVDASLDIGALSYAEMLSLPQYSFAQYWKDAHNGEGIPLFHRPTRREVAAYLASYPSRAGIEDAIVNGTTASGISRTQSGFRIASHDVECRNLVLASGTFSRLIPPRPLLQPLETLQKGTSRSDAPLLVIGSGFTAADVILSAPVDRKIIHIFKWDPDVHPSPLRACHPGAYPEYASIYRRMKLAARSILGQAVVSPFRSKKGNPFAEQQDVFARYEGLPNTLVQEVEAHDTSATIHLRLGNGDEVEREISGLEYVTGRRGSLAYLAPGLSDEITTPQMHLDHISGRDLRARVMQSTQIAPHVFAVGSLLGDSLIRFAYGGCVAAATHIIADALSQGNSSTCDDRVCERLKSAVSASRINAGTDTPSSDEDASCQQTPLTPASTIGSVESSPRKGLRAEFEIPRHPYLP